MKLYVVVKTAREDVREFPDYFGPNPHMPVVCLVDSYTGDASTPDREKAEKTANLQIAEYGRYFDYTVYELEVSNPKRA